MTCDILSCHPQGYTSLLRGIEWCFRVYESSEYLGRILWNVIGCDIRYWTGYYYSGDGGLYYTRSACARKLLERADAQLLLGRRISTSGYVGNYIRVGNGQFDLTI